MLLSLVAVLKRVILKIGRSDSLLLNFLVPLGGLFVTVSKWFSCLFFVGLAWAIVLPAHISLVLLPGETLVLGLVVCPPQVLVKLRWKPDLGERGLKPEINK